MSKIEIATGSPVDVLPSDATIIVSADDPIETIAVGAGIREIARLRKIYGSARWRKRKGIAEVRLLPSGTIVTAHTTPIPRCVCRQPMVCTKCCTSGGQIAPAR